MTSRNDVVWVLAEVLREAGLEAALIGAEAVNNWVEPRVTGDFDLVVSAAPARAFDLAMPALEERGFVTERRQAAAPASGPDFLVLRHADSELRFDLQTAKTPYQDEILRRARRLDESQPFPVATPEDLIVLKLIANRHKDQRDLIELAALPGIDWDYVERWAETWVVDERLAQLRRGGAP